MPHEIKFNPSIALYLMETDNKIVLQIVDTQ